MKNLLIGAVAAIALAGAAHAAPKEINFWHAMGGQLGELTDKFAADFNASQTEYQVNAIYKGDYTETMTSAIAGFRSKAHPHIVQVFEVGTATMMAAEEKGAVYPVYQLMADAGVEFDQSGLIPAVASYYTDTQNRLLSMPFNSSSPVMWYNKTKLDELGLRLPTTWDEVEAVARSAKKLGVSAPLSFGWQSWVQVENFLAWHNQPIGTRENGFAGLDTELRINSDAAVRHIARLEAMAKEGTFKYGGRRGDSRGMFVNGESILWLNSSAYYGGFKNDITEWEFGQAMLPLDTDVASHPQNSIIGGATLWVLKGHDAESYKGVAEFFKFISSPEQQASWAEQTGYVPVTTAAYELSKSRGFFEQNPGTDTAIKQLSLNPPTINSKGLRFGNFVQIRDVINEELEAVWAGQKDAKTAMDDAVARGNELLRRFQAANGS